MRLWSCCFGAHRESTRKPAVQAPPPQRSSAAKSQRGRIDPAENWASVRSAFLEGIGSACTHEAGTARTGFKKAAAGFVDNNRSQVLAASKVVTYLDETCEKRRRICGRPLGSGAAGRFRGRNQCPGVVGECATGLSRQYRCHPQILSGAAVGAKKYSWCSAPNTALACTATSSPKRCRDLEQRLIRISGGESGTPGPNAICGR